MDAGARPHPSPPGGAPLLVLCAATSLVGRGEQGAVGFHLLPPLEDARLVELTRLPVTQRFAAEAAEEFFSKLGFLAEWVEDAPGLVLGRIVCQLVNEAAFAIGEGVGSADDVDTGLTLGLSHPRGPGGLERGDRPRPRARRARRALGGAARGALPRRPAAQTRGAAWA